MKPKRKRIVSGRRNPKKALAKRRIKRARPVHKRILLHPVSILVLLCAGVLITGWTIRSFADSLTVSATVEAPAPAGPATITSPVDQAHFTSTPITVSGICASNSYVELFRNGNFSGVANCGAGVTSYQISTDLSLGANNLYTRIFSITDNEGPQSAQITVFYDQPAPPPVIPSPIPGALQATSRVKPLRAIGGSSQPFFIKSDYKYKVYAYGQDASQDLSFSGGTNPYAVSVYWGDGGQSAVLRKDRSNFTISHAYKPLGNKLAYYTIKVQAVDDNGAKAFLQTTAVVRGSQFGALAGRCAASASGALYSAQAANKFCNNVASSLLSKAKQWIWVVWPTYAVVVLMVFSFWLGERHELLVVLNKTPKQRYRRM